jgi:hypothetical protein
MQGTIFNFYDNFLGHRPRQTQCEGRCQDLAQKKDTGVYFVIPIGFWQKDLGYLERIKSQFSTMHSP